MVSALDIIGSDKSLQEHWLKRFVAIIIDSMIFYIIGVIIIWALNFNLPFQWSLFGLTVSGFLLFLYAMLMESSSNGATLGKIIMGLRVIPLTGEMDIGKAAMRNVSKVYGLFLVLDWLVGFATEGDPKQKWMDRVAGTTVVVTATLSDQDQHIYQSQQSKYAPPPQEPYPPSRHQQVYQYPPSKPDSASAQQQEGQQVAESPDKEPLCNACGGRMTETGAGRLKCIRCGKIQ